jgi:uncharacterized circularly permuted ATP-grasp superfamily protein
LIDVYRAGHVSICNAVGTGIADDKSIYPYVPQDGRVLTWASKPILNNVPNLPRAAERRPGNTRCDHLSDLVVKEVHGAGGYGMLVGPAATAAEDRGLPRAPWRPNPGGYIAAAHARASPACPTYRGQRHRPAPHRPAALRVESGKTVQMVPGGLTRVALKEGSLVVNSSQGRGHQGHMDS